MRSPFYHSMGHTPGDLSDDGKMDPAQCSGGTSPAVSVLSLGLLLGYR
jgi:hypothetical protein